MTATEAERTVHGTCHHDCPDSCGWTITVAGPTAVRIRGRIDHPYNAGELCPKVNRLLDRVYSPERLTTPLRRTGPKGSGSFAPISWDEALDEIAARLQAIIERHGAEAILPYSHAGNQSLLSMMGIGSRLFHHLGASRLERALCGPTVGAGVKMTNGSSLCLDPMELEHSRLIILWGTNTKLTNRHLWPTIQTARDHGARLVVIDPLRTATADAIDEAAGDEFIQPLPGTDIALMLAMMQYLIAHDLIDHEWVDSQTHGFDQLAAHVAEWTPKRAAAICGIDAEQIERLADAYGTIRPAVIRTLIGAEHHENGAMFFRTLACLPGLVGAWRDRGGGLSRSVGSWQDRIIDHEALMRPDLLAGRTPRIINMSRLGEALTSATPPVMAMVVWNANPMVTTPNTELIRAGLERDDLFTVVHENLMTDTARYADLVLPATTQIEATDVVPAWGHLWLGWNEAAIDPVGESLSNTEFFRRLAAALGCDEPSLFDDDMTLLQQALPDVDLEQLRTEGYLRVPAPESGKPWAEGGFPTPSGRIEFASDQLERLGQPSLPTFIPPSEGPGQPLAEQYPLQLLTMKHHQRFLNSSYSPLPGHGPLEGMPFIEIHPDDAALRQITEADMVRVYNDRAEVRVPARLSTRVRPGVVMMPFGWWRTQHGDDRSANSLTNDTLTDWGGGVAYADTLVEVAAG
jgi:anaerobic selenocysteine-containing dehydrogenase